MPDMFSGDCLTPYSTAAKTVDIDNYTLTTGVLLAVKFLAGKESTVPAHPTLNVSNTGAIPIVLETDEIEFIPGGNMLYLFTYDGEGYNIIGYNSEDNPDGVSKWYAGTHITGTSTTETVFPQSEVDNAVVGDMYLNTSTNNVYQCTFAGVPAIAKWKYIANIEGAPGFSPRATVTKSGSTATITITDEVGTTTETVSDGEDGQDGQDGQDGYSPTATVTKSGDTATITITDKDGTTTETVSDGTDGTDGQDGYSPSATVSKTGDTATITITDKDGTTTETISDGQDGAPGEDGQMLYAICHAAADNPAKAATLEAGTLTLVKGASVAVTFENENTSTNPTLNVANTGAKPIIATGENLTDLSAYNWVARSTVIFVYDGNNWQMDGTSSLSKAEDAQTTANNAIVSYNDINLFINGGYIVETTSPYGIDEVKVDKTVFYGEVEGVFGSYTFSYNGTDWILNGSTVDLISYGIDLSVDPTSGDVITVNLVDVEGAVTDLTNRITGLSDTVDANEAKAASDLESAQDELQSEIDANALVITETQNTVENISTKTQNMNWSEDYGLVLLAPNASFDTGYKLQLAAQAINFRNGSLNNVSSILASIAADPDTDQVFMMISDAIIENQLRLGKFAFIPRANGNMSLKYLG